MVSKEMAIKLKEAGLEWEPQRHDMYLRLYNQGCPMQPRCDINEVLSALPELIEREREAEKLIAAAEQRAEQAEAELKQLREVVDKLPNLLKSCMTLFANGVNAVYKHNDVEEHRSKARETERQIIDLLNKLEAQAERGQE